MGERGNKCAREVAGGSVNKRQEMAGFPGGGLDASRKIFGNASESNTTQPPPRAILRRQSRLLRVLQFSCGIEIVHVP